MNSIIKKRNQKLAHKVVQALQNHFFDAYYADSINEAVEQVLALIPEHDVVAWGGSLTLDEIGLLPEVRKRFTCIDRATAQNDSEKQEMMRKAVTADTFLMSSNAVSEDGQLVNIDGNGNRVAALVYGAKSVIVIVGMNKVVKSLEDAYIRAKTVAAPTNMQRFEDKNTPCAIDGSCHNCFSSQCICVQVVNTRISRPAKRIKVVLVGENLGL